MSQRVEPLLAAMAAGIIIANLAVAQGEMLKAAIQSGALPLLVVFFVATGRRCASIPSPRRGCRNGARHRRVGLIWVGVRTGLKCGSERRGRRVRVDRI